jgi:hypothetical protein
MLATTVKRMCVVVGALGGLCTTSNAITYYLDLTSSGEWTGKAQKVTGTSHYNYTGLGYTSASVTNDPASGTQPAGNTPFTNLTLTGLELDYSSTNKKSGAILYTESGDGLVTLSYTVGSNTYHLKGNFISSPVKASESDFTIELTGSVLFNFTDNKAFDGFLSNGVAASGNIDMAITLGLNEPNNGSLNLTGTTGIQGASVPEPATLTLGVAGLLAAVARRRAQKK